MIKIPLDFPSVNSLVQRQSSLLSNWWTGVDWKDFQFYISAADTWVPCCVPDPRPAVNRPARQWNPPSSAAIVFHSSVHFLCDCVAGLECAARFLNCFVFTGSDKCGLKPPVWKSLFCVAARTRCWKQEKCAKCAAAAGAFEPLILHITSDVLRWTRGCLSHRSLLEYTISFFERLSQLEVCPALWGWMGFSTAELKKLLPNPPNPPSPLLSCGWLMNKANFCQWGNPSGINTAELCHCGTDWVIGLQNPFVHLLKWCCGKPALQQPSHDLIWCNLRRGKDDEL